ncbi:hypothetical protein AUEXF2481DRAFT_37749 [Aureobasidium subglaciale EXF-2481]|uniref:Uncharacterized protein n=1 Tax=Aureobasidium subglaciale (strain EXF-2481) TaxID=1043005 RepID=A0A074YMD9_AURSE|nr:uncharacterized protein AUEXF2481DRAFT_37749 [Aureobasidium subglaciale EXF-2481]KEQ97219.1 hypothetical protein AUEXF2481DRAFT_37749 [Aureobasidium subglaciale EXF-2481]
MTHQDPHVVSILTGRCADVIFKCSDHKIQANRATRCSLCYLDSQSMTSAWIAVLILVSFLPLYM